MNYPQRSNSEVAPQSQRGAVLIVALLVLLLMALIASSVVGTNLLQLRMAGNDEAKTAALQRALAGVDAVLERAGSTPVTGGLAYTVCAAGAAADYCDESTITLDAGFRPGPGSLDYRVTRVGPLLARMPVMGEGRASSAVFYRVARFEVSAVYDGRARGLGRAALVQGVLRRVVAPAVRELP